MIALRRIQISDSVAERLGVASRAIAAIGGGYVLTALVTAMLARILPLPRVDAVLTATLLSFLIYSAAVLWAFAARTASRAWMGLLLASVVPAGVLLLLKLGV